MPGLIDIAPVTEKVKIGSETIDIPGISAKGIAQLLARFPDLRRYFSGMGVDADSLLQNGGEMLGAILATGIGYPNDEAQEEAAQRLPIGIQADLLAAILRVTLPNGLRPFMDSLQRMGVLIDLSEKDQSTKARDSKSPKPSKN